MTHYNTQEEAKAHCAEGQWVEKKKVNPDPQWDRAEKMLTDAAARGSAEAKKILGHTEYGMVYPVQDRVRNFDGDRGPIGEMARRALDLVWWDETVVWVVRGPVQPPVDWSRVEVPGGWKSDD